MAHPDRKAWVDLLPERLGADVPVHWDRYGDRWDTGRRSLLGYDPECDYHVVLQDDVLVPRDLLSAIPLAIKNIPKDSPISLFAGNGSTFRKSLKGLNLSASSWLVLPTLVWGPGLVLPTRHIQAIVAHGDARPQLNYDTRIGTWYEEQRIPCWYPFPSWVEHRDEGSLIGHRSCRALSFLGVDASCLDADMSSSATRVSYVPG